MWRGAAAGQGAAEAIREGAARRRSVGRPWWSKEQWRGKEQRSSSGRARWRSIGRAMEQGARGSWISGHLSLRSGGGGNQRAKERQRRRIPQQCECNLFCIECEARPTALCYYCHLDHYSGHRIRRSSYRDVIKVSELEDILDISDVQTYVINSAKVVFSNKRPQMRTCGPLSSSSYKYVDAGNSSDSNTRCEKGICNDNNKGEPPSKRVVHHHRKGKRAPLF
uniref:Uncharacterized protein n=1 Tax=Setaria italica TaxID=4555 RepID=K3XT10_SETIT